MPEGHTIHRVARDHGRLLVGRRLTVSSPQGRFAPDAARVDGATLEAIEAYGKHLFHHWSTGEVGHIHLGLFGKFRVHRGEAPEPKGAVRMRVSTDDEAEPVTIDLRGPTACTIGSPDDREAILARLGPDPLRADSDPESAVGRIHRSRRAIGALLLDQSVIAGIGNVYRAELLFVHGIHPERPGSSCTPEEIRSLWDTAASMLRAGVSAGRIVTVDRAELGLPSGKRIPRGEATYAYGRRSCIRCDSTIRSADVGGRRCYWCPTCQPT